jgi:hypothetical protein
MKTLALPALFTLLALTSACVDRDETIEVKPDGSCHVVMHAKGKVDDLGDGYALPFDAPWTIASDDARTWVSELAAATGGPGLRERIAALKPGDPLLPTQRDLDLAVEADFRSVADLPRLAAPASDPYASAYLTRDSSLTIRREGKRSVFVFERTYHAREHERYDVSSWVKRELPEELWKKLDKNEALPPAGTEQVIDAARRAFLRSFDNLYQDALAPLYVAGNAQLSGAAATKVHAEVTTALERTAKRERVAQILTLLRADPFTREADRRESAQQGGAELDRLEADLRVALRSSLGAALEHSGLELATRNAVLGELEWLSTARDATTDLGDETFKIQLRLPGTLVTGTWDEIVDGAAVWEFKGDALLDRSRTLRAVSVLD